MQATIQYNDFINNLDTAQRAAATISENAVIAAGAGSGKTKVLSSRYIFLVVEKKYTVDQILTLTFTQKAAVEMRTRIYRDLCSIDDPAARQAVRDFHKAQISTIDSFCSAITKQGCRQFGISPDYTLDDDKALSLAKKSALPFVLEHRNSPSIKNFLRKFSATDTAELFLAESVHYGASLSRPLNVYRDAKKQGTEVAKVWKKYTDESTTVMTDIEQLGKPNGATATQIVLVDNAAKILGLGSLPLLFDDASGQFGSFSGTALANGARYAELFFRGHFLFHF